MNIHITDKEYAHMTERAKSEGIHSMSEFDIWLKEYVSEEINSNLNKIDIIVEVGE